MAESVDLSDFLTSLLRRPFEWGQHDCILMFCNYAVSRHGVDPGRAYRGRYHDEAGANEIIGAAGGLLPLIDREMAAAGFKRVERAAAGNACLVDLPILGQMGALAVNDTMRAVISSSRSVVVNRAKTIAAWNT